MKHVVGMGTFARIEAHLIAEFGAVQDTCNGRCGITAPPEGAMLEVMEELEFPGNADPSERIVPPGRYRVGHMNRGQSSHSLSLRSLDGGRSFNIYVGYFDERPSMIDWRSVCKYIP